MLEFILCTGYIVTKLLKTKQMAKYKVVKQVDFGPYTILGPTGLQSDQVPINNYAPKIGDIIEGDIGSQVIHGVTISGIVFPIATNGSLSISAQKTVRIVPMDTVEPYVAPMPNPHPSTPTPSNPSNPSNNENIPAQENGFGVISPNMLINIIIVIVAILIIAIIIS